MNYATEPVSNVMSIWNKANYPPGGIFNMTRYTLYKSYIWWTLHETRLLSIFFSVQGLIFTTKMQKFYIP